METYPLKIPVVESDIARIFDTTIKPLVRLKNMHDTEYEDITALWLGESIGTKYKDVVVLGESKDAGRDVVAYFMDNFKKFDLYQCKHYKSALIPSIYWVEFGKLCYYTYIHEYAIPQKYYIVASNGIGKELRRYVENQKLINSELIKNWPEKCSKANQITAKGVPLTHELHEYIDNFDFSIVDEISPIRFLEEFEKTKWFKYYFGGGLKKRGILYPPSEIVPHDEQSLPYVKQLLGVYSSEAKEVFVDTGSLRKHKLNRHFQQQRHCFYSAQQLQRFARDELLDDNAYINIKREVLYAVDYTNQKTFDSKLDRVESTLDKARDLHIYSSVLHDVTTLDKCGLCHELVNDGELKWDDES